MKSYHVEKCPVLGRWVITSEDGQVYAQVGTSHAKRADAIAQAKSFGDGAVSTHKIGENDL